MDVSLLSQVSFEEVAHSQYLQLLVVLNTAVGDFNIFVCTEVRGPEFLGDMVSLALLF